MFPFWGLFCLVTSGQFEPHPIRENLLYSQEILLRIANLPVLHLWLCPYVLEKGVVNSNPVCEGIISQ